MKKTIIFGILALLLLPSFASALTEVVGTDLGGRNSNFNLPAGYFVMPAQTINSTAKITQISLNITSGSATDASTEFACYTCSGTTCTRSAVADENVTIPGTAGVNDIPVNLSGCQEGDRLGWYYHTNGLQIETDTAGSFVDVYYKSSACGAGCTVTQSTNRQNIAFLGYREEINLTTDLVACYDLESDGTDSYGSNDLSETGSPTYASGKHGNAFSPGNNIYLSGNLTDLNQSTSKDFSVGFWAKQTADSASGVGGIMGIGDDLQNNGDFIAYELSGVMTGNTGGHDYRFNNPSPDSTWYYWVFTWDESADTMALYQNTASQSITGGSQDGTVINPSPDTLWLGRVLAQNARYWEGQLDSVTIYDRLLSADDIATLYNGGTGMNCTAIAATGAGEEVNATPTASERLQQDSSMEQNASVSINSATYATVMSSSITISDDTWLYGSATIPLTATTANTATCRITIDGTELNDTETSRTLTAGSVGNMLISSLEHYVTAGAHNFALQCKRAAGGAYTVDNSSILFHVLTTPGGTPLETAQINITSAALPGLLANTTITTSDNYTATGLERYLIMDFAANYVYGATGNISVITEVAGTNCSEVKRYGTSGSTGNVGGTCFVDLGNETNSTTYDVKVFGTGTGSVTNAKFHVKEFIIHEGEVNGTSLDGLTGDGAIAAFNITVAGGHSTPDLVAQAILSVYSTSGSQTGTFYLNADGQNSTYISRTSNEGQPGVLGVHKDFETVSGVIPVTLYGDCALCSFTGQNVLAFVSSDLPATPNEFEVTATSSWDDSTINEFSINLSDGRSFSTTTGSISVAATGQFLNVTAVEQSGTAIPYFANSTLNHNSTYDLELNLTPYTAIYASGNATINNFTVNGTSTTNGVVYLRLYNDTYNLTISDADDINGVEYANQNATLTASPYLRNYTFTLKYSNTINISFYDEETGALITPTTVYLEAISISQSGNYSTTTGTITESFFIPDTYTLRYNALGYADSFYYLTIEDRTFNALNLTLLNTSSSSNVTLNVFDTLGNKLEGAIVKVLKYDVTNNDYDVTQILQTNFEGVAYANIVLNAEYYKFIIDYDGETRLTTNPTYIYGTDLTFYVPIGTQGMEDFFEEADLSGQITYNYATGLVTFTYSDLDNTASQGCLYAYTRSSYANTLVNTSCSSSSSGTVYSYAFNSSTNWWFEGVVTKGGNDYTLSTYRVDFTTKLQESGSGAFFAFILLAVVVFIGLFSLEVAVILGAAVPLLFTITGLASFDYIVTIPIFVLGLVTAFIIGSNKK